MHNGDAVPIEELFDLGALQRMQDAFAQATGVASIITWPDGRPITRPSRFCRLCNDIIRNTEAGRHNCFISDAELGRHNLGGPTIRPCLSGGLWDAGASITVDGRHVANWLIGQVRNEHQDTERMLAYADAIGADRQEFLEALSEVPYMSAEQFRNVAEALFLLANEISQKAYQSVQRTRLLRERENALAAQSQAEERYRTIFMNATDGIFQTALDGAFLTINPALARIFKYDSPEDFLSHVECADSLYADPADRARFVDLLLTEGRVDNFVAQFRLRDGGLAWHSLNAHLVKDETGKTLYSEGTLRDVTEHKRAEEALRTSEERFRTLVEQTQDAIIVHDLTGRLLLVNQRACDVLGYSREELLSMSVPDFDPDFLPRDDPETIWNSLPQTFESRHRRKDGGTFPVEVRLSRIVYVDQEVLFATVQDITERKRAEEGLRASEERYRGLYQNTPAMLHSMDRNGRLAYVSDTWCEKLGYFREEVLGRSVLDFLTEESKTVALEISWPQFYSTGQVKEIPYRFVTKDGRILEILLSATAERDTDGTIARSLAVLSDVTERKRAEEALRSSRDELAANQRKLSLAMELAEMGTWECDRNANEFIFNDQFYALYGTSCEREGGARMSTEAYAHNFLPAEEVPLVAAALAEQSAAAPQTLFSPLEHRIIRRDGAMRTIRVHYAGIWDESGRLLGTYGANQDITERKQAEEALRENRRVLQTILNTVPQSIVWKDRQSVIMGCNMAFAHDAGLSNPQDIVGKTDFDLPWLPEESEAYRADDSQVMATQMGKLHYVESQVQHDGRKIWLETSKLPLLDESGEAVGVMAIYEDITERKRAEEALRDKEEQLRTLINAMPEIVCFKDAQGHWLEANSFDLDLFQLTGVDYRGKKDSDLAAFSPFYRDVFLACEASDEMTWSGGRPCRAEETIPRPDGFPLVFDIIKIPVFYQDGQRKGLVVIGQDITERKRAEAELYAREQEFRTLAENSPDMIVRFDRRLRRIFVNPAWERGTGLSGQEAHGKTLAQVSPLEQEATDRYVGNIRQVLETGAPCEHDLDITRGQETRSVSVRMVPEFDKEGMVGSVLVIGRDITERKRAENTLRASEERLREQLEYLLAMETNTKSEGLSSILEIPAVQSLFDEFVNLTGAAIGLIGLQGEILVAAGWQDICSKFHRVHPEANANCVESNTKLVENVKPGEFFAFKCKNNMWDVATPLYIGDRHVANLFIGQYFYEDEPVDFEIFKAQADNFGFAQDAYLEAARRVPRFSRAKVEAAMAFLVKLATLLSTLGSGNVKLTRALWDQKQIEQNLRESQIRHKEVFDHSEDGILLTDITPEGQFRIAEINPAGEEMLGISRQDAVGRLLQDALPPDVAGRINKNYRRCVDHGATLHFEEEVHTAAGVKFLQRTQTPLRDHSGRICRVFSVARDVTARRQAEASLRASEKMNALGTLAGGIAHDFNNILGSVANLAALARGEIPPDSAARKDLDRILESTNVGKELVNQILAFCRLGKGSARVFDPAKVTRSVLDILKLSIPANLSIQDDISGPSGQVLGDPSQFHQIVLNLCSNAVDAMRGGSGILHVSLGAETLDDAAATAYSLPKAGRYVALKVADTGPGIPQDVLSRIFEPFFTTKPKGRGTGLGLAVVHGVVSRHQGAVVVETSPGQGTTFVVYVPVHEAEELLPQLAVAEPLRGTGSILLVDDDEVLLSSGKRLLEGLGYTVSACTGGDEALALFRAAPASIDLLITDLSMPCLNGKELALGALAIRPSLPIILCTGFGEALSPEEAKRIGIREYVHKPVNWNSLSVAIKGLLSNVVE
ncbi:MAG: hypothetical protein A2051_08390 [Desulfovibrionales bacterium GWA2_65_9]|nr:MAG: hypothetical protein A2051_08390 [Desulfovibrionales bacterium GWA2_65_9]